MISCDISGCRDKLFCIDTEQWLIWLVAIKFHFENFDILTYMIHMYRRFPTWLMRTIYRKYQGCNFLNKTIIVPTFWAWTPVVHEIFYLFTNVYVINMKNAKSFEFVLLFPDLAIWKLKNIKSNHRNPHFSRTFYNIRTV